MENIKSQEEISARTPLSITTVDNPIVKLNRGNLYVLKTGPGYPFSKGHLQEVHEGEEYRFIGKGCRLGKNFTPLRLGYEYVIWVPNECFDLVEGTIIGVNTPLNEEISIDHPDNL